MADLGVFCTAPLQHSTWDVNVASKLSFQPYREPAMAFKLVIFRKSSNISQFARPWLSGWSVPVRSVPAFWSGSVWPGWGRAEVQEGILWIMLGIILLCKTEAAKACRRIFNISKEVFCMHVLGSIYIISDLTLYKSQTLIFQWWAFFLSCALCCAPSMPLARVCAVQGALAQQRTNSWSWEGCATDISRSQLKAELILEEMGGIERPKDPFVLNVTSEI